MKEYALYKGDKFLELGSILKLARYLNVKPSTIQYYTSPAYRKRIHGNNAIIVIKIEDKDD